MSSPPPSSFHRYSSEKTYRSGHGRRKRAVVPEAPPNLMYDLKASNAEDYIANVSTTNLSRLPDNDSFEFRNQKLGPGRNRGYNHPDQGFDGHDQRLVLRGGPHSRSFPMSYSEEDAEASTIRESLEDHNSDRAASINSRENFAPTEKGVGSRAASPFSDASVKTSRSERIARKARELSAEKREHEDHKKTNSFAHKRYRQEHRTGIRKATLDRNKLKLEGVKLKAKAMRWNNTIQKKYPDFFKDLGITLSDSEKSTASSSPSRSPSPDPKKGKGIKVKVKK